MTVLTDIETYRACVNDTFEVTWPGQPSVPLRLVRVELKREDARQCAFALALHGPDRFLPQDTYELTHARLGALALSLVPRGRLADGFEYEAGFNLLKE